MYPKLGKQWFIFIIHIFVRKKLNMHDETYLESIEANDTYTVCALAWVDDIDMLFYF